MICIGWTHVFITRVLHHPYPQPVGWIDVGDNIVTHDQHLLRFDSPLLKLCDEPFVQLSALLGLPFVTVIYRIISQVDPP